jgi:hypothetical protein
VALTRFSGRRASRSSRSSDGLVQKTQTCDWHEGHGDEKINPRLLSGFAAVLGIPVDDPAAIGGKNRPNVCRRSIR